MTEQLFVTPAPTLGPCAWCGGDPVGEVELEPKGTRRDAMGRPTIKPPKRVPVCQKHAGIVESQRRFYSCGCSYEPNQDKCRFHMRALQRQGKFIPRGKHASS